LRKKTREGRFGEENTKENKEEMEGNKKEEVEGKKKECIREGKLGVEKEKRKKRNGTFYFSYLVIFFLFSENREIFWILILDHRYFVLPAKSKDLGQQLVLGWLCLTPKRQMNSKVQVWGLCSCTSRLLCRRGSREEVFDSFG
jgi:hypothetical protein